MLSEEKRKEHNRIAVRKWAQKNKERKQANNAAWREKNKKHAQTWRLKRYQNKREQINAYNKEWKRNNPEKAAESNRKAKLKFCEEIKAMKAVYYKVRSNEWPKADELLCAICGNQAKHYHHHIGYEQQHWYDVIPVCVACHRKIHRELRWNRGI